MTTITRTACVAVSALFAVSACTDPAYQAGGERERTARGAQIGALVGAATGVITGGDNELKNAAVGAAIGAGVGAGIGAILDQQARELRGTLGDDVEVINTGDELIVRMPQDILFAVDSDAVRSDLRSDLFSLADNLQRYPESSITIVGHTDNTGSAAYNQDLSLRRANAVADVLINAGLRTSRIATFGAGESTPIASNLTPEGRTQNRRVDITIRPN